MTVAELRRADLAAWVGKTVAAIVADPGRLTALSIPICDDETDSMCRVVAKMYHMGCSLRVIARVLSVSKSTLHRELPGYLVVAALSQMGQPTDGRHGLSDAPAVPSGTAPGGDLRLAELAGP